jgi:hypothetical protein
MKVRERIAKHREEYLDTFITGRHSWRGSMLNKIRREILRALCELACVEVFLNEPIDDLFILFE